MADVTYTEVVKLVDQLKPEEKQALVKHLQEEEVRRRTPEEFRALFESVIIDAAPADPNFSFRREDWYGDDDR
jgi:hypothetical protein